MCLGYRLHIRYARCERGMLPARPHMLHDHQMWRNALRKGCAVHGRDLLLLFYISLLLLLFLLYMLVCDLHCFAAQHVANMGTNTCCVASLAVDTSARMYVYMCWCIGVCVRG